jgi:hypothetical protein
LVVHYCGTDIRRPISAAAGISDIPGIDIAGIVVPTHGRPVGVVVVPLRAIILFPAVAVDAPGASWSRAMADTRGYTWRIYSIVVLAALPLVLVSEIVG